MVPVDDVLAQARKFSGQPYVFGAEITGSTPGPVDCSELVEAACRWAGVTPRVPDGSWIQYEHCLEHQQGISVERALGTRGALLFLSRTDPPKPGRDGIYHVAFSLGDGTTFEAWKAGKPVGSYTTVNRGWYRRGGLIPGVDYRRPPTQKGDDDMAILVKSDGGPDVFLLQGPNMAYVPDQKTLAALESQYGSTRVLSKAGLKSLKKAYPVKR